MSRTAPLALLLAALAVRAAASESTDWLRAFQDASQVPRLAKAARTICSGRVRTIEWERDDRLPAMRIATGPAWRSAPFRRQCDFEPAISIVGACEGARAEAAVAGAFRSAVCPALPIVHSPFFPPESGPSAALVFVGDGRLDWLFVPEERLADFEDLARFVHDHPQPTGADFADATGKGGLLGHWAVQSGFDLQRNAAVHAAWVLRLPPGGLGAALREFVDRFNSAEVMACADRSDALADLLEPILADASDAQLLALIEVFTDFDRPSAPMRPVLARAVFAAGRLGVFESALAARPAEVSRAWAAFRDRAALWPRGPAVCAEVLY